MPQNYKIIELPGKSNFRIATTDIENPENNPDGVKSPEWMIKIDDLTTSDVDNFNGYTELFGWHGESSRFTTGDISNNLFTSATLKHSDLVVLMSNGGYAATLETNMNTGTPINVLTIIRLGNIKATKVTMQQIDYTNCFIQSFQQQLDRIILRLTVTSKTNTIFVYDKTGLNQGQVVSTVDYSKNTAQ
ncbi:MAG: hypothetical protein K2W94_08970 [Alphaproteobacteria bacterium]|nr:hypothetical protein [Alphaproteobacteria bacterium]